MPRDINFVAALEKAVKDRYGVEATYNPKQFWDEDREREYLESVQKSQIEQYKNLQTQEKIEVDGLLLPKKLFNTNINKECKHCNKYSFDKKDDLYLNKFNVCYKCYVCNIEDKNNG